MDLLERFRLYEEDENTIDFYNESFLIEKYFLEDEDEKDKEHEEHKVNASKKEKAKNAFKFVKNAANMSDAELEGSSKKRLLARKAIRVGISGIATGAGFMLNPILGLIAATTSIVANTKVNANERDNLIRLYSDKLDYLNSKIEKEDNDEEKYKLKRLASKLETDIKKLEKTQENAEKRNEKVKDVAKGAASKAGGAAVSVLKKGASKAGGLAKAGVDNLKTYTPSAKRKARNEFVMSGLR